MKKFLTILLLSAMALTLVACATVSAAESARVETTATPKTGKVKINEFLTIDYDKPFIIGNNSVAKPISPTNTESYEQDIAVEPEVILEGTDAIAAQIEEDMTYAEVCEVLGAEGVKLGDSNHIFVYEWSYENGDSILISFEYLYSDRTNKEFYTVSSIYVEHVNDSEENAFRIAATIPDSCFDENGCILFDNLNEYLGEPIVVGSGIIRHIYVLDSENIIATTGIVDFWVVPYFDASTNTGDVS